MIFLALNQVMNANETYILLGTIIMIALTVFYIIMWMKEYIVFFKKDLSIFLKHNSKLIRDMIKKGSQVYRKSNDKKKDKKNKFRKKNNAVDITYLDYIE